VWKFDGSNWASNRWKRIELRHCLPGKRLRPATCSNAGTGGNGIWKYKTVPPGPTLTSARPTRVVSSLAWSGARLYAGMNGSGVWEYDGSTWTDTGAAEYVGGCLDYDTATEYSSRDRCPRCLLHEDEVATSESGVCVSLKNVTWALGPQPELCLLC